MRCGWLASVLLAAQCALAGDVIRLRSRVIQPIEGQRVRSISPGEAGSFRQTHFLLQFSAYPGPELRRELSRRGLRVLGYVPDSGLTVACRRPVDLSDLDVTWAGNLSATDKLSPTLGSTPAPGYLVVFFADVDMDVARALAARHGFGVIENRGLLRSQLILAGSAAGLKELAAEDEVSYILPASPDLVSGMPVTGCAGALAEAGPVAEYVAVGRGWAKDAGGAAALKYYIQNASPKMDQNGQRSEIERALREWARYANVTFTPGSQPAVARTIAIQFAGRSHGDAYPFDGLGGTLAHTFYPSPPNPEPVAGDMHFDADENWRIGADTDLFTVALHEAGHALGLGHSDRPGSVMYPYYRFATGLTDDDIAGAQALYGKAGASIPAPPHNPGHAGHVPPRNARQAGGYDAAGPEDPDARGLRSCPRHRPPSP